MQEANALLKMAMRCLKCCLYCFEKTVRYSPLDISTILLVASTAPRRAFALSPVTGYNPLPCYSPLPCYNPLPCYRHLPELAPHHATPPHRATPPPPGAFLHPSPSHHPPHQVRFVTGYGFVYVAMEGSSFCSACFKTFQLILGNLTQVARTAPQPTHPYLLHPSLAAPLACCTPCLLHPQLAAPPHQVAVNTLVSTLLTMLAMVAIPVVCAAGAYTYFDDALQASKCKSQCK